MKVWVFTTKEVLEYIKLDENDEIKRASTPEAKKGDIILIYRGYPHSNIKFIFKAKSDSYNDPDFRESWDTAIDLFEKIEILNPIEFKEMNSDPILGDWNIVRKNFMGSFFEMPTKEWNRLKTLILEKNPELENKIRNLVPDAGNNAIADQKWTFAINKDFYLNLKDQDEIIWNSPEDVKKDNLIMIYTGSPYSNIGFILKALTDPFEDPNIREQWNRPAVNVEKLLEFNKPISLQELRDNPILSQWSAVRMGFRGSHFKMSDEEFSELIGLIIDKNPQQRRDVENIIKYNSIDERAFTVGWGRAHIVRDICYLINENPNINEEELFNLLRGKVGDNGNYWKAYYQRANKKNSPKLNLDSARNLKLINPDTLELTDLGLELVKNVAKSELFTHSYNRETKKFYFKLALDNPAIKTAMQILQKEKRSRFYAPTCDLTNKVVWNYTKNESEFLCKEEKHPECKYCDRDLLKHIKETSLPFETDRKVENSAGYVFWMCSRITPMHLTGKDPEYSGNVIYWDEDAEKELGDLIKLLANNFYEKISIEIIRHLFKEFNENYLTTDIGIEHLLLHNKERDEVKKYFNLIRKDENIVYDTSDPIINYILPIKRFSVAPAGVKVFGAFKNPAENIPEITLDVFNLLKELIVTDEVNKQKELIRTFKAKDYKGFQSGIFSSVFYYLNSDYWYINNKTVATFNFLSDILDIPDSIDGNLNNYIDNLSKLKKLVGDISEHIPILGNFEVFDVFCHWLCDKDWGYYAKDSEKYKKWLSKKIYPPITNFKNFKEFLSAKEYLYEPEILENFLLSLKVKPFVILTGNSGTGKTKIAQLFAEYLEHKNKGNHQIIPVGANWTENRHLLGFYNVIIQDYQNTPSLELLLKAKNDKNNPYLLILDEMNLSHVERYFADFLSAMESGKSIPLHSNNNGENELTVPETLKIVDNVFVVGTVNVDETTYMFSPKVLDRANTIEFATYPAKNYILGEFEDNNFKGDVEYLEDPLSNKEIREAKIDYLQDALIHVQIPEGADLWTFLAEELHQFQDTLSEAGFDFGFRVIDEILRFMYVAWIYENKPVKWTNWRRYFDAQIMQKMLPKMHGSQRELDVVLEKLFNLCCNSESDTTWYLQELNDANLFYPTSAKKLQWMGKILQEKRFVSFTN